MNWDAETSQSGHTFSAVVHVQTHDQAVAEARKLCDRYFGDVAYVLSIDTEARMLWSPDRGNRVGWYDVSINAEPVENPE